MAKDTQAADTADTPEAVEAIRVEEVDILVEVYQRIDDSQRSKINHSGGGGSSAQASASASSWGKKK